MPQVTGAVNWETNVEKRQTTQKNPVIADNSLTRIENTHMEARMRIQVRLRVGSPYSGKTACGQPILNMTSVFSFLLNFR